MASHHDQQCEDSDMESNNASMLEPNTTVIADDNLGITSTDPVDTASDDDEEMLITQVHEPVKHLGSEHLENFYVTDQDSKMDTSNKDGKAQVISVPSLILDGRSIIIFCDACQAVLKTWGSLSNLQNLSKEQGIEVCQFDQSQLRMLKNLGVIDVQVKCCSFITEDDFIRVLHKCDEEFKTDKAKYFQLSPPVTIDNQGSQSGKEHYQILLPSTSGPPQNNKSSPFNICTFSIGNQDFVTLAKVYGMFETHFHRPDLLSQALQNLKMAVGTFTANELARVEIHTGVTCNDSLRGLYITRKDFERLLQYTSAFLDTNPPDITWVQLGKLSVSGARKVINQEGDMSAGLMSTSSPSVMAHAVPEGNNDETVTDITQGHILQDTIPCNSASSALPIYPEGDNSSASETSASNSSLRCVIRTCLVNGEVVVCIPDLHKVVIDLYGQSVQVGNYMHRLKILTRRFSSILLKRLKAHNILSSKATLCTYITKADAERLLKMYHMGTHCDSRSDNLPVIEWSEPIVLENAVTTASEDPIGQVESEQIQHCDQAKLKIPLYVINYQVVVSMPDVHKAVQLLNGQSVQLRYNLDKLGITKLKYSYSEVHLLKILGHLNRPSSCTYITKADVDKLLQYYATPENKGRLKLIDWQQPIAVENVMASDSRSIEASVGTEVGEETNADGQMAEDYSISDLYKVFVGDDVESIWSGSNEDDDNQREKISQPTSPLTSSPSPVLSFSLPSRPPVSTPDPRVNSVSDQLQTSTTTSSHMLGSQKPHSRSPVNQQVVVDVNQMQVDVSSRSVCSPVRSQRVYLSPIVTNQMGMSNHSFHQVTSTFPSSSCASVPETSKCTTHTSSITACATPIITAATVHSPCAVAPDRHREISSTRHSTFTSCGKLSMSTIIIIFIWCRYLPYIVES